MNDLLYGEKTENVYPNSLVLQPPLPKSEPVSSAASSIINKVTDKTFPAIVLEEILDSFRLCTGTDAVWQCGDGVNYRVHRVILALNSSLLKVRSVSRKIFVLS